MTLEKFIVVFVILAWAGDSWADHHRSKRSTNEYILRRCIATAELIRRHRNEGVTGVNLRKAEASPFQSQTQRRNHNSTVPPTDVSQLETLRQTSSSAYRRTTHMRRRGNAHARRIMSKHLADTPLRTLHIKAPQNGPSAFRKKSPLPELARDVSGRKIDSLPNVILIQPAN